ncbi:hypothetical protein FGO68_gene10957 [Halteria grandinella]|uniref:HMG box domain-containing protein n=1 Tax=Halteria grandinella TaxID=5974 RepID=A0A8J8NTM9_HALGN|nr:hypothetical protein FGO68_gene10957 [Halteria grandinella]
MQKITKETKTEDAPQGLSSAVSLSSAISSSGMIIIKQQSIGNAPLRLEQVTANLNKPYSAQIQQPNPQALMGFKNQPKGQAGVLITVPPVEKIASQLVGNQNKKLSPFLIYVKHRKTQIERERIMQTGQSDLNMKMIVSQLADEWRNMSEPQKQVFRDESNNNPRVPVPQPPLLPGMLPPHNGIQAQIPHRRAFNSIGEPFKKPMTPYMCFLKEQTALQSQTSSQVMMKDLVKYGAQKWNTMDENDREPYRILAEIDQIRYQRDRLNLSGQAGSQSDKELAQMQQELVQKINSTHQPQILIQNNVTGMNAMSPMQLQSLDEMHSHVKMLSQILEQLEQKHPAQANSALYYFDQEHREGILNNYNGVINTPKEAFEVIMQAFINLPESEKIRYEGLAEQDQRRYMQEEQELQAEKEGVFAQKCQAEQNIQILLQQKQEPDQSQQKPLVELPRYNDVSQLQVSTPSAILSHPFVHQLQIQISTHENLLVQQASLLHILIRALIRRNITVQEILEEEENLPREHIQSLNLECLYDPMQRNAKRSETTNDTSNESVKSDKVSPKGLKHQVKAASIMESVLPKGKGRVSQLEQNFTRELRQEMAVDNDGVVMSELNHFLEDYPLQNPEIQQENNSPHFPIPESITGSLHEQLMRAIDDDGDTIIEQD